MTLITAYKKILDLNTPIFKTEDISIILQVTNKHGYAILKNLADAELIIHLKKGLWAIKAALDPFMLPDYLTFPMPSYISLQSALYYHGIISQIPTVIYAVSIAKTRIYQTPVGVYSIHHIATPLFTGFNIIGENGIRMATAEKALFDFFYYKAAKTKLFHRLPEVEIPGNFSWNLVKSYVQQIKNASRKVMVTNMIRKTLLQYFAGSENTSYL